MRVARPRRAPLGAALAFGLAVYLLALLARAPADLIGPALRSTSQGHLMLAEAQGTLWAGSGQMRVLAGRSSLSRHVVWHLAPLELLHGRLSYQVLAGDDGPFGVSIGARRVEFSRLELRLPAAVLGAALPRLDPLGLTGELRIAAPALAFDYPAKSPHLEGRLVVRWLDAGSRLAPVSPFGAYELALQGDAARVGARVTTLQGPLELAGQGEWANGGLPSLRLDLNVPESRQAQFAPFLRMFAVEKGGGRFEAQLH